MTVLAIAAAWYFTGEGLPVLLFIVAALVAFSGKGDERGDPSVTALYITLVGALTALAAVSSPTPI